MILAYGGGEILRLVFSPNAEDRLPAWLKARSYFLSGLACLAASLINPYTYHLHVHMVQYLRDPWNSQHIMEFLSPTFHHPTAIFFEAMLVMAVAAAIWNLRQGRFTEALLVFVWAHGGLLAARNIPIFMIAAAPPVAAAIQQWLLRVPDLNVAAWLRAAAAKFNRVADETAETDSIAPPAPGERSRPAAGGRAGLRAASAQEVSGGVRSHILSRRPPWQRCEATRPGASSPTTNGATI